MELQTQMAMEMERERRDELEEEEEGEEEEMMMRMKRSGDSEEPPLMALNHVSRLCRSVEDSIDFYVNVLGFVQTKRPKTLKFDGAWLFNYGIGIHLVQSNEEEKLPEPDHDLDPMDNHISFQCADLVAMERKLKERNIKYKKRTVSCENGEGIDQLFFSDPDGFMIEICNCENIKLVPAESRNRIKLPFDRHVPPVELEQNEVSLDK